MGGSVSCKTRTAAALPRSSIARCCHLVSADLSSMRRAATACPANCRSNRLASNAGSGVR
eukprot:6250320-Prymnesium_polylepis.1